jgi:hypothetical protein
MYPAIPLWDQVYNWDWLSDENLPEATLKVVDEHIAIITEPYMLFDLSVPEEQELNDILVGWFENFIRPDEAPEEPMSDIMYPVIAELDRVRIINNVTTTDNTNNYTVVAGIRSAFYWRDTIQYILPEGNNGFVIVFQNPCAPSFTYQIK